MLGTQDRALTASDIVGTTVKPGLGAATLDPSIPPTGHPGTRLSSPQSFATSAVNRRSQGNRADVLCDIRVTVIFHTDTQKKCFIYILPSKEFEQQRRTY